MFSYLRKIATNVVLLCLVISSLNAAAGSAEGAAGILDNPPPVTDFPDCPAGARAAVFVTKKAEIEKWFKDKDPTGVLFKAVFPTGLPSTAYAYNQQLPKTTYTNWYNARHGAGGSAISEADLKAERERLEAGHAVVTEQIRRQAAEAERRQKEAEESAVQERQAKEKAEQVALTAQQQLVAAGQQLQVAQLDSIVSKSIPANVARVVMEMLNHPEYKTHEIVCNDADTKITLTVTLKDSSQIQKEFQLDASNYQATVDGFQALMQQRAMLGRLLSAGAADRPDYQIHLTPRPEPAPDESPALKSLVDAYYYTVDSANNIVKKYSEMKENCETYNLFMKKCYELENKTDDLLSHVNSELAEPSFVVAVRKSGFSIDRLITAVEKIKNGEIPKANLFSLLSELFETQQEIWNEYRVFSKNVFGLFWEVGESFSNCLRLLNAKFKFVVGAEVGKYLGAISKDQKMATANRKEELKAFYDQCKADAAIATECHNMTNLFETEIADVREHVFKSVPRNQLFKIGSMLKYSQKQKLLKSHVVNLFLRDSANFKNNSGFFLFYLFNSLDTIPFFIKKETVTIQDSPLAFFYDALQFLNVEQKKVLFVYIYEIIQNFDSLVEDYRRIVGTSNRFVILSSGVSTVKTLESLLEKIYMSLDSRILPEPARRDDSLIALYKLFMIADQFSNPLCKQQIAIQKRTEKLDGYLADGISFKTFLKGMTKEKLDGFLDSREAEETLKKCLEIIQSGKTAETLVSANLDSEGFPNGYVNEVIALLGAGQTIYEKKSQLIEFSHRTLNNSADIIWKFKNSIEFLKNACQTIGMQDVGNEYNCLEEIEKQLQKKLKHSETGESYYWACDLKTFNDLQKEEIQKIRKRLNQHLKRKGFPEINAEQLLKQEASSASSVSSYGGAAGGASSSSSPLPTFGGSSGGSPSPSPSPTVGIAAGSHPTTFHSNVSSQLYFPALKETLLKDIRSATSKLQPGDNENKDKLTVLSNEAEAIDATIQPSNPAAKDRLDAEKQKLQTIREKFESLKSQLESSGAIAAASAPTPVPAAVAATGDGAAAAAGGGGGAATDAGAPAAAGNGAGAAQPNEVEVLLQDLLSLEATINQKKNDGQIKPETFQDYIDAIDLLRAAVKNKQKLDVPAQLKQNNIKKIKKALGIT